MSTDNETKKENIIIDFSLQTLGQVMSILAPDFSCKLSQAISFSEDWDSEF